MIFKRKRFKTLVLLLAVIVCGSVLFLKRAFSYNDTITHPSLTANVAGIYNSNNGRKLTDREISWLKQGSIEEDKAPRWLNHFYNPQTNQGLWNFPSAKNWSQNPALQSVYFEPISGGNQTWQKAISSFAKGDEKAAFVALGHVLHLLEDTTVPAHTRLDAHPDGDPYEKWAVESVGSLINFDIMPAAASNLDAVFDNLANYSSINFLSKDTIKINQQVKEEIINKKVYLTTVNNLGEKYKLVQKINISNQVSFVFDNPVHSDYFYLLAPKAVAYGAGVVKLFFEEAEKKKQEEQNKSWWQKLKENASSWLANISGSLYAGIGINEPASNTVPVGAVENNDSVVNEVVSQYSLPLNAVEAREKIAVSLPNNTIEAEEKLGGIIEEESLPSEAEKPSLIAEETSPEQAVLPTPSAAPTPSPTPSPSPTAAPSFSGSSSASSPISSGSDDIAPETTITLSPAVVVATTTAVFIFESSESDSTFMCSLDNVTSTACESPKEYSDLTEGSHSFKVSAKDAAGNEDALPAEYDWTIDLAPEADISLSDYSLLDINFTVNWSSSSSDTSYYDVQYKVNSSGEWQDWAIATSTVSKSFQASYDNSIYYFRVRAVDLASQAGVWQEIQAPISLKPIIFNEIMYNPNPGTDDYYEYIELYNRSPIAIDLADWEYSSGSNLHIISADQIHNGSSTIIASGGFALLTDKVTSATATSTYDGYYLISDYSGSALRLRVNDASLGLINSGSVLVLKNASGSIVDEVSYLSGWGANGNGRSLERINYNNLYSQNQLAWAESSVGGTPNAVNGVLDLTAGSQLAENTIVSSDFIWAETGSPYLLNSATVNAGATLIIESGAIIKPQNKFLDSLTVHGALKINGTSANPILFTSKEASPQAGDWGTAINFASDSLNSKVFYATFEYGGYQAAWPGATLKPSVVVSSSIIDFDNCVFRNTQSRALDLIGSNSVVANSQFSSSTVVAIYISGSSMPEVKDNVFQNSGNVGTAIKIDNQASPAIGNNSISGFAYAIWLQSSYPDISGNVLIENYYNGIYIDDHTIISQDANWQNGNVYLLMSNSNQYPAVATSTTLTLEPGVIIKPLNKYYSALKIEGSLLADGNSSSTLINFTSFKDDLLGGDSNNDGSLTSAASTVGDWKNVWFAEGSQSTLKFVKFQFGGFNSGINGEWRVKEESLKIDSGASVFIEESGIE